METKYTREKLLTTPQELQKKLAAANLCLVDVRPAEEFARGHIPGAVHFDLFGLSLVDTSDAPLKAFMYMIHHVLELRGVSDSTEVVFYEDNSGMRRTRALVPGILRPPERAHPRRRHPGLESRWLCRHYRSCFSEDRRLQNQRAPRSLGNCR